MLLALFAGLASISLLRDSVTFDETPHIVAGYSYLDRGDFRLNPEHPPLAKMWAAVPLWISNRGLLDYASDRWAGADAWKMGHEFLCGPLDQAERRNPQDRLVPARLAMVVLGVFLGLVVYAWSRELWGWAGGLVSLFLYALSPTVLAHTRLVTTDVPAALGYALALWSFWRFCRRPGWIRTLLLGLALGIAFLLKYSTLLLLLLLPLLWLLWVADPGVEDLPRRRRLLAGAACLAVSGIISIVCIWACYRFRSSSSPDGSYAFHWDRADQKFDPVGTGIRLARSAGLLPQAYLHGLSAMLSSTQRPAYLNGEVGGGWWHYFPEAFLLKTTPAVLLLLGWMIVAHLIRPHGRLLDAGVLAIPVVSYFVFAVGIGMNIGHRHLLPIYPLLFVFAGTASRYFEQRSIRATAAWILLTAHAASSLSTFPRYLSYFNLAAGGAKGGWRFLGDSNIDWGQDLLRLKSWMDEHQVPEIHLAYFGTADPRAYKINCRKLHRYLDFHPGERSSFPTSGDYVAVSVTLLQGLYSPDPVRRYLEDIRVRLKPMGRAGNSIFIYRIP